ncbi:MAG: DUF402 domain-containing protein, partial [Frankia sp.]|nr:DUF402 domain-containing protein [Frankia sp.]
MAWSHGDVVLRREVLHGRLWCAMPTYVVADDAELLVVFLQTGSKLGFPEMPAEWTHAWHAAGHTQWSGHGRLMMHRPGDAYSVDVFWEGPDRRFAGWYLNLQEPYRRSSDGFSTLDHELDLWMPAGGAWRMKDEDLFEQRVREGR